MKKQLGLVGVACTLALSLSVMLNPLHAADDNAAAVDDEKVEKAVEDAQEKERKVDSESGEAAEAQEGEASYNVADCEALLEEAGEGGTSDKSVESIDLDECEKLVK